MRMLFIIAIATVAIISPAAVVFPEAPSRCQTLVREQLANTNMVKFLLVEKPLNLTIADMHRVYGGNWPKHTSSTWFLSDAKFVAWRCLLLAGTNVVGSSQVRINNGELEFNGMTKSWFDGETLQALHVAEGLPRTQKTDYEFRLLDIPARHLFSIWLHAKSDDIILPLPSATFRRMEAYHPYTEREIAERLDASG